jgi:hypothetical protein
MLNPLRRLLVLTVIACALTFMLVHPSLAAGGRMEEWKNGRIEEWRTGRQFPAFQPFGLSLRTKPSNLPTLQPSAFITATKTYTLSTDSDGDQEADPGDVLSYTVVISNDGVITNTGLIFSDTLDPNLSQLGLVSISPIAFDDRYNTATNPAVLSVPDGPTDLFANDYPGLNPAVTGISFFGGGSLGGAVTSNPAGSTVNFGGSGSLTVSPSGSFTFTPVIGFQGVFTFLYRLQNPVGPGDGLVAIAVDAPPTVTATSPISGATGITTTTNITITFSESVNYSVASFSLECPGGSAQPFSLASTSPSISAVLNPNSELPAGVICTVTVLAAQVSDADPNDPPDNMLADYTFTFAVPPQANDDTYNPQVIGNVGVNTANSTNFSVLSNDQGPGLSITGFGATSAQGGTVALNTATGTFSYTPARGFEGTDSFTYTIANAAGSDTGTVNLTVGGMIWFVDANAGAGGDGRLSTPYNTLAAFQAVNDGTGSNPADNDNIFLAESATAYTGGVTLLTGQRLIGQDATVSLAAATGLTPPADSFALPVTNSANGVIVLLNSAATAISLGSGNTLRGLTVGDTTANDISGTNFGTLAVLETTLNGTGRALNLLTGTLTATFGGVSSTSGTNNVNLVNVSGTANLGSGTLSGASNDAFVVNGGTISATYNGNITQNSNTALVRVLVSHNSGTLTFQTGTLNATNGTGLQFDNADGVYNFNGTTTLGGGDAGVDILNGSTGTFSFGTGTAITNPSGDAFELTGSNANVTYSGAINDSDDFAIDIDNHDTGTVTFQTGAITSNGINAQGIRVQNSNAGTINFNNPTKILNTGVSTAVTLSSNGGATLNFTGGGLDIDTTGGNGFSATGGGTVTVQGTGNSISSGTGTALNVTNTNIGLNSLTFRSISTNGATNGIVLNNTGTTVGTHGGLTVTGDGGGSNNGSGGVVQNSTGHGISLTSTRDVSLGYMNVQNSGDDGIHGIGVVNFTLNRSNVNNNGNSTSDDGLQFGEASGSVVGVTGIVAITNSSISGNAHNGVHVRNTSGIINSFTVTGSTFNDVNDTFGANAFLYEASGTSITTAASITGSTFQNNTPQRALEIQTHDTANIGGGTNYFVVSGNTFINNGIHASFTQDTASNLQVKFLNNGTAGTPMTGSILQAVNLFSSSQSTGGTIVATISGNFIGNAAVAGSGGGGGITAVIQGQTDATLLIDNNFIRATPDARGIAVAFRGPANPLAGTLGPNTVVSDVTITNNNVDPGPAPSGFPLSAIVIEADNQTGADNKSPTVRADLRGNTVPATTAFDLLSTQLAYYEYDGAGSHGIGQLVDTPPASADATAQLTSTNTGTASAFGVALIAGPINTPP